MATRHIPEEPGEPRTRYTIPIPQTVGRDSEHDLRVRRHGNRPYSHLEAPVASRHKKPGHRGVNGFDRASHYQTQPAIIGVCRQLRIEALSLYYAENVFDICPDRVWESGFAERGGRGEWMVLLHGEKIATAQNFLKSFVEGDSLQL